MSKQDIEKVVQSSDDKMLAVLSPVQRDEFEKMHGKKINITGSSKFNSRIGQLTPKTTADELRAERTAARACDR
jgi:BMFP domain-containing protein YqiC